MSTYQVYNTHGFKIYLDVNESAMMRARSFETYEVSKFNWLKANLKKDDTFIDVGSNKGDFALLASLYCNTVYAVEPHPDNLFWLKKSIDLNQFNNINIIEGCASNSNSVVRLGIGKCSGWHSMTANYSNYIEVNSFRLDDIVKQKSLVIKIDVEGAEKLVLDGLKNIIPSVRAFLIDVDSGDKNGVIKYLTNYDIIENSKELIAVRQT